MLSPVLDAQITINSLFVIGKCYYMKVRTGDIEEVEARASKIRLALFDVKRGLRQMKNEGEYSERINSLENTLDDIPSSNGVLPAETGKMTELGDDELLEVLDEISGSVDSLKEKDSWNRDKIDELIEETDEARQLIDKIATNSSY